MHVHSVGVATLSQAIVRGGSISLPSSRRALDKNVKKKSDAAIATLFSKHYQAHVHRTEACSGGAPTCSRVLRSKAR